jgi:basic membrane protein A
VVLVSAAAQDGSFNQYMVDGMQAAAAKAGNVSVKVVQGLGQLSQSQKNQTVCSYARQGYNLVIAHGFDLVPGVQECAGQFPKVDFATSLPVTGNHPNVVAYLLNFEQFGYAGAFLACQGTKAHIVGIANGPKASFDDQELYGFRQGVAKFCPGTKVINIYGDFADSATEKEAVTEMASQGADSVFSGVSASQPGVLSGCQAAHVACWANSKYAPASDPSVVLGTVNYDYGFYAPTWIHDLEMGKWTSGLIFISMNSGSISVICTPAGEAKYPGIAAKCKSFNTTAKAGGYTVKPLSASG